MKYSELEKIPLELSHRKIEKKVILQKGDVPNLMFFNWAKLKPGESLELHSHENMYEVFYGLTGKLECVINEKKIINLKKGNCLTLEPGEMHKLNNPYKKETTFLCYGIAKK